MSYLTPTELENVKLNTIMTAWLDETRKSALMKLDAGRLSLSLEEVACMSILFNRAWRHTENPEEYSRCNDINTHMGNVIRYKAPDDVNGTYRTLWTNVQAAKEYLTVMDCPYNMSIPSMVSNEDVSRVSIANRLNWYNSAMNYNGTDALDDFVKTIHWKGKSLHPMLALSELWHTCETVRTIHGGNPTFIHLPSENHLELIDRLGFNVDEVRDPDGVVFWGSLRYAVRDILESTRFVNFKQYGVLLTKTESSAFGLEYQFMLGIPNTEDKLIAGDGKLIFSFKIWLDDITNVPLCNLNGIVFPIPTYWIANHLNNL